jgi:hypothetical protein
MAFFSEYGTYDSGSVRRQRLCTAHRGMQAIGSKLPETRLFGSVGPWVNGTALHRTNAPRSAQALARRVHWPEVDNRDL